MTCSRDTTGVDVAKEGSYRRLIGATDKNCFIRKTADPDVESAEAE